MDFKQGMVRETFQGTVFGDSCTPFFQGDNTHQFSVSRIASNGSLDAAGWRWRFSINQGQINLFDLARFKLLLQPAMRPLVLCDNNQPGSIFVQPVDNPRALLPANPLKFWNVTKSSVDQSASVMPGRGMNNHPG